MKAEGSVEVWLNQVCLSQELLQITRKTRVTKRNAFKIHTQLLNNSKASLHGIIRETFSRTGEPDSTIIEVLEEAPAQVMKQIMFFFNFLNTMKYLQLFR